MIQGTILSSTSSLKLHNIGLKMGILDSLVFLFLYIAGTHQQFIDPRTHPKWPLVLNSKCGISQSYRIIGGHDASLGQYPWMARLVFQNRKSQAITMKCGGCIINDKYILSAAHCFTDQDDQILGVRLGELYENTDPDCDDGECAPPVQDIAAESVILHERYSKPILFANDIALIRLKERIEFSDYVLPICLPYGSLINKQYAGENVEVAGWGIFDLNIQQGHETLQTLTIPVVSNQKCQKVMKKRTNITEFQFCGSGVIGKDSCGGDSGGPVMKVDSSGEGEPHRYFVLGLVSFGTTYCGETTIPGVYTKVAAYVDWILDNIDD